MERDQKPGLLRPAFVVIHDACVLYPSMLRDLRDLLARVGRRGIVRAVRNGWATSWIPHRFSMPAASHR
ncbi:hypothetical protein CP972_16600 [Streptomyces prasinus]|uniref:Uncharacterized protein n=1 Tax=Streptomyces prasinus TaxID=67345 RepID=A0ABX6AZF5_9ACTN|nr:hypothetical protein CP972_16600 [Streptomyces prasinus]